MTFIWEKAAQESTRPHPEPGIPARKDLLQAGKTESPVEDASMTLNHASEATEESGPDRGYRAEGGFIPA